MVEGGIAQARDTECVEVFEAVDRNCPEIGYEQAGQGVAVLVEAFQQGADEIFGEDDIELTRSKAPPA
jgi:hypothetical protein